MSKKENFRHRGAPEFRGNSQWFVIICRTCKKEIDRQPAERPPDKNGENYGHGICQQCKKKKMSKKNQGLYV